MAQATTVHIINDGRDAVPSYIRSLPLQVPELGISQDQGIVYRDNVEEYAKKHPTIVASAGGGHEPMFNGFVGKGMLSASVAGTVFASPNSTNILHALEKVSSPHGTVLVIANYTGDLLNAGLALTRAMNARGPSQGPVRLLCIGDDVSIPRSKVGKVGRRGLAGHLLVIKYLAHLADTVPGITADELHRRGELLVSGVGTVSCSFSRASHPNAVQTHMDKDEQLPPDTIELGMGAHGEPGLIRLSPIPTREALVERMCSLLLDRNDPEFSYVDIQKGDRVYVLVNSLGGTSDHELAHWSKLMVQELARHQISVQGLRIGNFVTSLGMQGWGASVVVIPRDSSSPISAKDLQTAWESDTDCFGW